MRLEASKKNDYRGASTMEEIKQMQLGELAPESGPDGWHKSKGCYKHFGRWYGIVPQYNAKTGVIDLLTVVVDPGKVKEVTE
jgi:hypothetical protein